MKCSSPRAIRRSFKAWSPSSDRGQELTGKVILDTSNPVTGRDGAMALDAQKKGAGVAALSICTAAASWTFNCIGAATLAGESDRQPERIAIPIGGDDTEALVVAQRLGRVGRSAHEHLRTCPTVWTTSSWSDGADVLLGPTHSGRHHAIWDSLAGATLSWVGCEVAAWCPAVVCHALFNAAGLVWP